MRTKILLPIVAAALFATACKRDPKPSTTAAPSAAAATATASATPPKALKAPTFQGGALARTAAGDRLIVADEDHKTVRWVDLPKVDVSSSPSDAGVDASAPDTGKASAEKPTKTASFTVPGAPAQVLALGDGRLLVTLRDPGALFVMKPDVEAGFVEEARVALPADAWGIGITPDEKTALVTSAWTHKLSAIDLATKTVRWTIDVAREPRAVIVRSDGASAYVTHLVGAEISRVDGLAGTPSVRSITLPPAPERAPSGKTLHASLAYSAALSPDGRRLYVPRHALGAMGSGTWFGTETVDVLATSADVPVLPKHAGGLPQGSWAPDVEDMRAPAFGSPFVQPRAIIYRKASQTLLIAGEGTDNVVELDALSAAPAAVPLRTLATGHDYKHVDILNHFGAYGPPPGPDGIADSGAGPVGLALSQDENELWVYCAASHDLEAFLLTGRGNGLEWQLHLADDPLSADAAIGRKFYMSAIDGVTSGGLACAGCHPEGRDDGMVWHEAKLKAGGPHWVFLGEPEDDTDLKGTVTGYPRQTPMLAGRLGAVGPYGWHAQAKNLDERLREGFQLHRWVELTPGDYDGDIKIAIRVRYLSAFVREGLVPPPREQRELTAQEELGKKLFSSAPVGCATCHVPGTGYTDRAKYPMPVDKPPPGFEREDDQDFKTPSLLFVGGTAPYFHDGRAKTLEQLIDQNDDRMGHTKQLSNDERAALVAFLRTL